MPFRNISASSEPNHSKKNKKQRLGIVLIESVSLHYVLFWQAISFKDQLLTWIKKINYCCDTCDTAKGIVPKA